MTSAPPRRPRNLLRGANVSEVLSASADHFSDSIRQVDILDVQDGFGTLHAQVQDDEIRSLVKKQDFQTRIIFIDQVEEDREILGISSQLQLEILEAYGVSARFVGYLNRQYSPGTLIQYDENSRRPRHHSMWYSSVIRTNHIHGDESARDLSRKVCHWARFCVWSGYDITTKQTVILSWGCEQYMKRNLCKLYQGRNGEELQHQPWLVHTFFIEEVINHTYDFQTDFSNRLYQVEFKVNESKTAEDHTKRLQSFLAISRQTQQFRPDYEILGQAIEHLKTQNKWLADVMASRALESTPTSPSDDSMDESQRFIQDSLEWYMGQVELVRNYSRLYDGRAKLGVDEGFAMVNQWDAEVNLQMASESTQIARASHQDSQALRVIQILSVFFVPASLISSIFGMGFFSTSPSNDGGAVFSISDNWWWYLAIVLPLTVAIILFIGGYSLVIKWQAGKKDAKVNDFESQQYLPSLATTGFQGSNSLQLQATTSLVDEKGKAIGPGVTSFKSRSSSKS